MSSAIIALLTIIAQIAPSLGATSTITAIINALITIIPTVVKEIEDVVPIIKNIIAALQSNTATTPDQMAQLTTLDAQCDAAFEAAATAAETEDAAVKPAT
jgi:hypothetical protein